MEPKFNHFDEQGNAIMVDVSAKSPTRRLAVAEGKIRVSPAVLKAVTEHTAAKGDVLGVARVAGIMGAKRCSELIPLCHLIGLTGLSVDFQIIEENLEIRASCTAKTRGKTGVEMEALTGVTTALLTVYDMCKAVDKSMELGSIYLEEKSGGKSGHFRHEKAEKGGGTSVVPDISSDGSGPSGGPHA